MTSRTIASLASLIYSKAIAIKLKTFSFFAITDNFFICISRLWNLFWNCMCLMRSFFVSVLLGILLFYLLLTLFFWLNGRRFFMRLFLLDCLFLLRWLRRWLLLAFGLYLFFWCFFPNYFVLYCPKLLLNVLTIRTI